MRTSYSPILAGICYFGAAFPAVAAPVIPDCAGAVEVAHAKVVRVEKNGALILSDGRAALLEGIHVPLVGSMAAPALDQLRDLAMAGPLTLTAVRPKEDRYDRVRVQAFGDGQSGTRWLQLELLRQGLARVDISPDRNECAPDLYEAESAARTARKGLWALPAYAVRTPETLKDEIGSFQLVEGRIVHVERHDGRIFLDFSGDWRHGFTATIAPEDAKPFREQDPPVDNLAGHLVRLRGVVESYDGRPEITLSNPAQIELLN